MIVCVLSFAWELSLSKFSHRCNAKERCHVNRGQLPLLRELCPGGFDATLFSSTVIRFVHFSGQKVVFCLSLKHFIKH